MADPRLAGAIGGISRGILQGYQIGSDIQARRLAERRATRLEGMEREKFEIAKSSAEESSLDRATLRAEKIADSMIDADFDNSPLEQQEAVRDRISTAFSKVIPDEDQRGFITRRLMETTLKAKKDAAGLLSAELEFKRAGARGRAEGKVKDPVEELDKQLHLMSKRLEVDVRQRQSEKSLAYNMLQNPDATPEQRAEADQALMEARLAKADVDAMIVELSSAADPLAKVDELMARLRGEAQEFPTGELKIVSQEDMQDTKAHLERMAASGTSPDKMVELVQALEVEQSQKDELLAFISKLVRKPTGFGEAQADTLSGPSPALPEPPAFLKRFVPRP